MTARAGQPLRIGLAALSPLWAEHDLQVRSACASAMVHRVAGVSAGAPRLDLRGEVLGQRRLGVRLISLIAYLRSILRMPCRSIQEYLETMHQMHLSTREIVEVLHRLRREVRPTLQSLRRRVYLCLVEVTQCECIDVHCAPLRKENEPSHRVREPKDVAEQTPSRSLRADEHAQCGKPTAAVL